MMRTGCAVALLAALSGACGAEPVQSGEHAAEVALIARQTLLWAKHVDAAAAYPAAGFSVYFAPSGLDLGCGDDCVGTAWENDRGVWQVWVAAVDERGQAPTEDVFRMPVAHELVHVLFGDPGHARAALWGPTGIVQKIYTDLVDHR